VLFLDEAPEFAPQVIDALRTPLESGTVQINRSEGPARFPARFQLILAANPCPCGLAATPGGQCQCAPLAIRRYAERISGPIRDRIDINQGFLPVRKAYLKAALQRSEPSAVVAERVREARQRQLHRLAGTGWRTNSEVAGVHLRKQLPLPEGWSEVEEAHDRGRLSSRGVDKVLRLSWTVSDLAGRDVPGRDEVGIALAMRRGEQPGSVLRGVG
jgi:magnesium chelatase family protein